MPWVFSLALVNAGSSIAARMAMIAITTSSSIRVKPALSAGSNKKPARTLVNGVSLDFIGFPWLKLFGGPTFDESPYHWSGPFGNHFLALKGGAGLSLVLTTGPGPGRIPVLAPCPIAFRGDAHPFR